MDALWVDEAVDVVDHVEDRQKGCAPSSNASYFVCVSQTGLLVVYVINAGIAYLSYLEAKRVGQVSSGTTC